MTGLQLSGLASGLDWKSLVDQLIQLQRVPQDRLRVEKATAGTRSAALTTLQTRMKDLQDSLKKLNDPKLFSAQSAASSGSWNVTTSGATPAGSYEFNVTQRATASRLQGALDVGSPIAPGADVSGVTVATLPIATAVTAGTFTVNGAQVSVAPSDSLADVLDRIGSATGGAVTAAYDPAIDGVRLSSGSEIVVGSANDTSNFLRALQLFNNGGKEIIPPKALGVVSLSTAIENANLRASSINADGNGDGSFSINGVEIAYNVQNDSLQAVINRINASTAGVTASFDRASDRFVLQNNVTGDLGLGVSEAPGGLLAALGLTGGAALSRGLNAEFSVNGGATLTSFSNTFDASAHGIAGLSVTATTETTETMTIGADTAPARTAIEAFVTKFNDVQKYITAQTKITTGADGTVTTAVLAANREVGGMGASLRSLVFDSVPGLSGAITRLEGLGLDFSSTTSTLEIKDSAKLDAALRDSSTAVSQLFTQSGTGLAARLNAFIERTAGTKGTIGNATEGLTKQSKRLDDQIANLERRLEQQRSLLEASFIRMEEAQANIQRQQQVLTNSFNNNSNS